MTTVEVPGAAGPGVAVSASSRLAVMSAVLLRLLLIVTLVLNGSGAAMASVRIAQQLAGVAVSDDASMRTSAATHESPQASGHRAAATHADAARAAPPCHDMPATDMHTVAHPRDVMDDTSQGAASDAPQRDRDGSPHAPSPSHCDGGTCQCACLHVAQAMTTLPRIAALDVGATAMPQPAIDAHADPALPHVIRPPIA